MSQSDGTMGRSSRFSLLRACLLMLLLNLVQVVLANVQNDQADHDNYVTSVARKKKKKFTKYLLPILVAIVVVKILIVPFALKAMAIISGKAFLLSALSLILASINGLKKLAQQHKNSWERIMLSTHPTIATNRDDFNEQSYHNYRPLSTDVTSFPDQQNYWP